MVRKKYQSKRMSLRKKYKVLRKVREHGRKVNKESKGKKPGHKDPGIPNSYPFKQELMAEVEARKEKIEKEKEEQRKKRQRLIDQKRKITPSVSLEKMTEDAKQRDLVFSQAQSMQGPAKQKKGVAGEDNSRRAFYREFKRIIESADVILEVLDARDPIGCRAFEVERAVMASDPNKKIILVLNKIDLVPKDVVRAWIKYLRNDFPVVAFKCSTQEQRANLGRQRTRLAQATTEDVKNSSECLGADTLIQLLKNYARSRDVKLSVTCGIIGYPNVGKSSLINSLKRAKVVNVGAQAGVTKVAQEIHLDKNVKLLDCPGILFDKHESDADVVLRNVVRLDKLADPIPAVEAILQRCSREQLVVSYKIPLFKDATEFLISVSQKHGKLKKGGVADLKAAAVEVLQDWNKGKIPFFTRPPVATAKAAYTDAAVVSGFAKEFDLDGLLEGGAATVLEALPDAPADAFMALEASARAPVADLGFLEDEGMDLDDAPPSPTITRASSTAAKLRKKAKPDEEDLINPQANKERKKEQQREQRAARRAARSGDDAMAEDDGNDAFDWSAAPPPPESDDEDEDGEEDEDEDEEDEEEEEEDEEDGMET